MKKPNFKIDLKFLTGKNKGTLWQKAVLGVLLILAIIMAGACAYLVFRPISKEIKEIIDEEISSVNITFDQKTIDSIKARQEPSTAKKATTGKNPFAPF